jgi:hypothetical protein
MANLLGNIYHSGVGWFNDILEVRLAFRTLAPGELAEPSGDP